MKTKSQRSTLARAARNADKRAKRMEAKGPAISNRLRPATIGRWLAEREAAKPGFVDGVFKAYANAQTKQARVSQAEPRAATH